MDRNSAFDFLDLPNVVALRKESVDRNGVHYDNYNLHCVVALRKESVDRNTNFSDGAGQLIKSLSARRAWIEIKGGLLASVSSSVALRKESVDRNNTVQIEIVKMHGRSPQGERG